LKFPSSKSDQNYFQIARLRRQESFFVKTGYPCKTQLRNIRKPKDFCQ
jgi:hypothetical protein